MLADVIKPGSAAERRAGSNGAGISVTGDKIRVPREIVVINGDQRPTALFQSPQIADIAPCLIINRQAATKIGTPPAPLFLSLQIEKNGFQPFAGQRPGIVRGRNRRFPVPDDPDLDLVQMSEPADIVKITVQRVRHANGRQHDVKRFWIHLFETNAKMLRLQIKTLFAIRPYSLYSIFIFNNKLVKSQN